MGSREFDYANLLSQESHFCAPKHVSMVMTGCGPENTLTREEAESVFGDTKSALSRMITHGMKVRDNRSLEFNFD